MRVPCNPHDTQHRVWHLTSPIRTVIADHSQSVLFSTSMSLRFHKDMFTDVFNEDGLLVAAKGLGVASVMLKFVKLYAGGKDLVFILSAFTTHEVPMRCLFPP